MHTRCARSADYQAHTATTATPLHIFLHLTTRYAMKKEGGGTARMARHGRRGTHHRITGVPGRIRGPSVRTLHMADRELLL